MLKLYTVYFELYGKRLKARVKAESVEEAKKIVTNKINFVKVEEDKDYTDVANTVNNILKDVL